MNILITGAGGFIGQYLCRHLGQSNEITAVTRKAQHIVGAKHLIVCDLTLPSAAQKLINKLNNDIDIIISLASRLADSNNANSLEVLHDNVKICETVTKVAQTVRPCKIINFSSMAVYPNETGIYTEESPAWMANNSDCIYGLSKFCEENIISFFLREFQIDIIHLRLAQVYGEGMREDRIIPKMNEELIKTNKITVYGDGERISSFISVEKVCKIVEKLIKTKASGLYNAGGQTINYGQLAKNLIIKNEQQGEIVLKPEGSRAKFVLDSSKINQLLRRNK